jgi:DNA-binding NtrC family response regulator
MPNPIQVLVVDDDLAVLRSLSAFLEDEGFTVFAAADGEQAIQLITTQAIDVVVADVRLREMSGEELLHRCRAIRPTTKYLVHTGSLSYRLSPELTRLGMTEADVLYKPVPALSQIADAIRRVAGRS